MTGCTPSAARSADFPARHASPAHTYKWWVVFMLWFVCFFNYADRQALSSVLPLLSRDFGFDAAQLGLIGSAFAWVYAAAAPGAGILADRFRRKRIIAGACVVWSGFTLATCICGGLSSFVAVRALTGLGETFYFPAAMALLSDYHGAQTRSRAMSWHQSAVYAGTILGSWVAALLAERVGWRAPFLLFGPGGIVLALILSRWLIEPVHEGRVERKTSESSSTSEQLGGSAFSVLLRNPAALLLMLGFLCANLVAAIFLVWMPSFLVEKFHYSLATAGLVGTLYIHLSSALAVPIAGWSADRLCRLLPGGRMLVQAAGLVFGAGFVVIVARSTSTGLLLPGMSLFGVCKGFYDSGIFASLYDVIEANARGMGAGLMNTIGWVGGALGPLLVGLLAKYGSKSTVAQNMSDAMAMGAWVYAAAAACLLAAMWLHVRRRAQSAKGAGA